MSFPNLQRIVDSEPVHPPEVPKGWYRLDNFQLPGARPDGSTAELGHYRTDGGAILLLSLDTMEDGSQWLHFSVSYQGGPPGWAFFMQCKNTFFGRDVEAVQVLPKQDDHVELSNPWHAWVPVNR